MPREPMMLDFNAIAEAMVTFRIEEPLMGAVRMTRLGKWVNAKAKEYIAWQTGVAWRALVAGVPRDLPRYPGRGIVIVRACWKKQARVDSDNLLKAVLDSLWRNDRRCLTVFADATENTGREWAEVHVAWKGAAGR